VKKLDKKSLPVIAIVLLIVLISFLWQKNRDIDIKLNSKYAIAKITKQLSSLKNGNQWYYEFGYNGKLYEWYRSTHAGYDVKVGDYFLVEFSSKNPEHSKILYQYQLKPEKLSQVNYIGDTVPTDLLMFREEKGGIW
jgi:hypothetical protein